MKNDHETRMTIRFPSELAEEVKAIAHQEHRSINSEVVHAVQAYVRQYRERSKRRGHESV